MRWTPGVAAGHRCGALKVFLVRHADADAEIPEGLADEARALTTKARAGITAHFASVKDRLGQPDLFFTSPLVRCVQTSMLLAQALGYEGPMKAHRALLPDMPVGAIDALLTEQPAQTLVLVGHQPSMGAMASYLLGQQNFPKQVAPGSVIGLDVTLGGDGNKTVKLLFFAAPHQPVLETL